MSFSYLIKVEVWNKISWGVGKYGFVGDWLLIGEIDRLYEGGVELIIKGYVVN